MLKYRLLLAFCSATFFGMLAVSAATGFPEGYFKEPWPRSFYLLVNIVTFFRTAPFGPIGASFFFTLMGLICVWVAFNPYLEIAKQSTRVMRSKPLNKGSFEEIGNFRGRFDRSPLANASTSKEVDSELITCLELDNFEHIEWIKNRNHPADNYEVVAAIMCFIEDDHHFIDWIIDQPDLDRGTAAFIFLGSGGLERIMGVPYYGRIYPEWADRLIEAVCFRSENRGFQFDRIAPPSWARDYREKLFEWLSVNPAPVDFIIPYNIFRDPFLTKRMASNYIEIGEAELVLESWWKKEMPF